MINLMVIVVILTTMIILLIILILNSFFLFYIYILLRHPSRNRYVRKNRSVTKAGFWGYSSGPPSLGFSTKLIFIYVHGTLLVYFLESTDESSFICVFDRFTLGSKEALEVDGPQTATLANLPLNSIHQPPASLAPALEPPVPPLKPSFMPIASNPSENHMVSEQLVQEYTRRQLLDQELVARFELLPTL